MNKDQIKGTLKETAGKLQQTAGEVVGSEVQQAKGLAKQAEGKLQKEAGNVKENIDDLCNGE